MKLFSFKKSLYYAFGALIQSLFSFSFIFHGFSTSPLFFRLSVNHFDIFCHSFIYRLHFNGNQSLWSKKNSNKMEWMAERRYVEDWTRGKASHQDHMAKSP